MAERLCEFPGCIYKHKARGLCKAHYAQQARGRELTPTRWRMSSADGRALSFEEAFWERVDKTQGCWIWTGKKTTRGYGQISRDGRIVYAHRVSFELANDGIEESMLIDHLCHTHDCVNPAHLRAATQNENEQNRKGAARHSRTGIRNVRLKKTGVYEAELKKDGQRYRKHFRNIEDADAWATQMRERLYNIPRI